MTTESISDHAKFAYWSAATALRGRATEAAPERQCRDSQRVQAGYFKAELSRQLELLDGRAVALHARLSHHLALGQAGRVRDVERELRSSVVERREIVEMIKALDHRFERSPMSSDLGRPSANLQVLPGFG